MKKVKQILAIIGIILLVVLYGSTIICAFLDIPDSMNLLMASIAATFIIPVLIWTYSFIYRLIHKDDTK